MSPPIYARAAKAILGSSLLDAPAERVVGVQRAPGVLNFILRPSLQHFFNNVRVIRAALGAGNFGGGECYFLLAGAFDHGPLRAPSIDHGHLNFLNLVARFDILDYLYHGPPFPFLGNARKEESKRVAKAQLPEEPPPRPSVGWLLCLFQLVVPKQLRLPVGEQNLKRCVVMSSVALPYRTNRPLPLRLSVIQLHLHTRADPGVLYFHLLLPLSQFGPPLPCSAFSLNTATSLQTYRGDSVPPDTMCRRSPNTTKRIKVFWTTTTR